ncbi:hypothetical protein HY379_02355 [Candidatus Saccharibacteria bacterium]|nr:hypothetical protein [Candidatus Saccharibacteria bacterium]
MRASSLVLPADVLQVKFGKGGDGHYRIVICTAANVGWPDEKSTQDLRADIAARVQGIKLACITAPMKSCEKLNIWLVVDLGTTITEAKALWLLFEVQRVVYIKRYFAKKPSPDRGRRPDFYVNRSSAPAHAA